MSRPLVSILMNCYNGERYLRQAIESVIAQSYTNWEIIFWDNQSTDDSKAIATSYNDPRIKYHYAPTHTWLYEARGYALEKVSGEFLAFLDVDDWWVPEKLERQLALFDDPDVGFACGNFIIESEKKGKNWPFFPSRVPEGRVLDTLLPWHYIGLLTLMARRSALDTLDYVFDPRYHVIGDLDLGVRMAAKWKLGVVQEPIAHYRIHGSNESDKHRARHIDEMRQWIADMSKDPVVSRSPSWPVVLHNFAFLQAMDRLLGGERAAAFGFSRGMPLNLRRLKLTVAMLLPLSVVRQLRD